MVDFTPYHQPVLFSVSAALYWYFVFDKPDRVDLHGLRSALESYGHVRPWSSSELSVLPAMLIRESLRRLAVPLALAETNGRGTSVGADLRHSAAVALMDAAPELAAIGRR